MPDDSDQPLWVEGDPAFLLEEGVGYVHAWARAQHAASALQQALADLGCSDAMPYLHADVNVFGAGVVELGRVTPETATLIVQALLRIKQARGQQTADHAA